jgi:hypothetical protein
MSCAAGEDGDGVLLHYVQDSGPDPSTSRCGYPEVAGCDVSCWLLDCLVVVRSGLGRVSGRLVFFQLEVNRHTERSAVAWT